MRFSNQTAIVTGGATGIGLAVTRKLAGEGANVWIFDMNEAAMKDAAANCAAEGLAVKTARVDIADESSVEAGFRRVCEADDNLSIVVNSAGIVGPTGIRTDAVSLADFEKTCRVNLTGSFIIAKQALKALLPKKYGRILLIASIAGKEGNAGMAAYSASKAGVIGLVKAAGKEYAESGVTINGVAPATIKTPMVEAMGAAQVKYMTDKIPMKRCGQLDEIANLVAWIVSREASFNTGFTFDMTGGRAVY